MVLHHRLAHLAPLKGLYLCKHRLSVAGPVRRRKQDRRVIDRLFIRHLRRILQQLVLDLLIHESAHAWIDDLVEESLSHFG